jgi:molecular chaperone IbpA
MSDRSLNITDPFGFSRLSKGTIGFDDMFKQLSSYSENLQKMSSTFPNYNIKKTAENIYVIELAVAGFGQQDIELILEDGVLTVKGQVSTDDKADYLFKGIADRAFTRKFTLSDTVEIQNADLINGMLKIWLEKFVPETKKPKKIEINNKETFHHQV